VEKNIHFMLINSPNCSTYSVCTGC